MVDRGDESAAPWVQLAETPDVAVTSVARGSTVLVGGFGDSGYPMALLEALARRSDVTDLTLVSNNAGRGDYGIGELVRRGRVSRLISTYPIAPGSEEMHAILEEQRIPVDLVPQGTMAERLHAGGAGLGGILTPVGVATAIPTAGQELRLDGHTYRFEPPLRGDVACLHAAIADPYGNLRFRTTARNFNPVMGRAATTTIVEVDELRDQPLDPDDVHLPGIFVDIVVQLDGAWTPGDRRAELGARHG